MDLLVSELMHTGAYVYRGDLGSTLPAKTLAVGDDWPAGWERLGATSAPLILSMEAELAEATIEQALGVVDRGLAGQMFKLETRLSQVKNATAQNLASGEGGTVTNVAALGAVPASQELKIGGYRFLTKSMWGFEGEHMDEVSGEILPVRGIFYRATVMPGWELQFDKTKYSEGLALPIGALEDMSRDMKDRVYCYYFVSAPAPGP